MAPKLKKTRTQRKASEFALLEQNKNENMFENLGEVEQETEVEHSYVENLHDSMEEVNVSTKSQEDKNVINTGILNLIPESRANLGEDINYFCNLVRHISKLGNWDEEESLILVRSRLQGRALDFFMKSKNLQDATSIKELEKLMIVRFGGHKSLTQTQLAFESIKHTPYLDIDDLAVILKLAQGSFWDVPVKILHHWNL